MADHNSYRETPNTGRTPKYSEHELDPVPVDPSALTDDRQNPDLLMFEKTWGHRVLAGLGVAMIVIAIVLIAYCVVQIVRVADIIEVLPMYSMALYLYVAVLIGGVVLIPPACIAIYVAKHPAKVTIAIVAAVVALALVALFFGYWIVVDPQSWVLELLYSVLFAIVPVIYLLAALKVKRSL